MVVLAVIIAILAVGARYYFWKKAKGEHSSSLPSDRLLLPGNCHGCEGLRAAVGAAVLCPSGSLGDVTDHSCSSPWGVTLITKDLGFAGRGYCPWILQGIKESGCFPSWATQKK